MKIIFLTVLLSIALSLTAGETAFLKDYTFSYPQTVYQAMKAPLDRDGFDWQLAGGIVFTGMSLYLFDEEIHDLILRNRSPFTKSVSRAAKQFGEGKYILPAMGVSILGGYAAQSPYTTDTGLLCLKSFLLANTVTQTLKYSTQRHRPLDEKGKQFWQEGDFSHKRESFPSGHVTVVWSIAPILAKRYQESKWVAPVAYSTAVLTSLSRIHDEKHWASDVFAGAVIGQVTANLVLRDTPLSIGYSANGKGGINLSVRLP